MKKSSPLPPAASGLKKTSFRTVSLDEVSLPLEGGGPGWG